MNQTRLFLDTNILVYAHDASSQHHDTSAALLSAIFTREFKGVLAEQNLFELYRILTNPVAMKNKPLTAEQAKTLIETVYLGGIFQIVYLTPPVLQQVLTLAAQKNITSAKIFDLRLAAIALAEQVDYFVTFNIKDFAGIEGLTPCVPQQVINR